MRVFAFLDPPLCKGCKKKEQCSFSAKAKVLNQYFCWDYEEEKE
jgi:hypothetical protein